MADDAQVRIVNSALFQLGNEPVVDLSDTALQASNAAVKILRVLDSARDTVLARHGWLCAMAYAQLAPSVIDGAASWKYPTSYLLPGDGLRVWEIDGCPLDDWHRTHWGPKWELGTIDTDMGPRQIIRACDADPALKVAYTRRCSWGALSAHVADAIAFDVAARACYSVTGDNTRASALMKYAENKALLAVSTDGTQEGGQDPLAPSIPAALRAYSR